MGSGVRGDTGRLIEDLPTILAGNSSASPAPVHAHEPRLTMAGVAEGWTAQSELDLEELVIEVLSAEVKEGRRPCPAPTWEPSATRSCAPSPSRSLPPRPASQVRRRILHDQIDHLQTAIVHRYKVGAADPDSLLN